MAWESEIVHRYGLHSNQDRHLSLFRKFLDVEMRLSFCFIIFIFLFCGLSLLVSFNLICGPMLPCFVLFNHALTSIHYKLLSTVII
jgi:hypothetical protein